MSRIKVRNAHMDDRIEHPAAYEAAIRNRIKQNASKTRRIKWFEQHADARRLYDWLNTCGEFKTIYDDEGNFVSEHPLRKGIFDGDFGKVLLEMRDALDEWGGLTDKQTDLVRRALARAEERLARAAQRREERLEADRAGSAHVGAVGERREFSVLCEKSFSFEGHYGVTYINICRDEAGNVIVYKGSQGLDKGWRFVIKATVKAHGEREGVKQTIIARPKFISETAPEEGA
jgi:hypothetical protein